MRSRLAMCAERYVPVPFCTNCGPIVKQGAYGFYWRCAQLWSVLKWSWKLLSKSPEISSLLCYSVSNLLSMFVPRPSHTGSCPALPMDSRGSGTWIFQMERLVMSHTSYILNSFQIFPSSRLMLFFCSCSTKVRILPFKTTSSRRTQFNRVIPKKLFDGRRERKQFCSASIIE